MKRVFVLALAVAFAPLAGAQLYKYVDKDGKTVYTDQPPANVQAKPVAAPPPPPMPAAAAGSKNGTNGNKSAVERDKDNEKNREQAREQQKKQQEASEKAQQAEQRCQQARENYRTYEEGGRLFKYNDKGEREFLGDEEIEAKRISSKKEMDEACAGS
jgi:type IV secretory pathway VirB10-like protein